MEIKVTSARALKRAFKILISGVSGSGKTYSSLQMAKAFGSKKILLIDSENSASLYSYLVKFDVVEMRHDSFKDNALVFVYEVIKFAEQNGYDCIIIDGLSFVWNRELEMVEEIQSSGKTNSFTAWNQVRKLEGKLFQAIIKSPVNIIATARRKMGYSITVGERGSVPKKTGLEIVQKDGIEHEFDLSIHSSDGGVLTVEKSRFSSIANDKVFNRDVEEFVKDLKNFTFEEFVANETVLNQINLSATADNLTAIWKTLPISERDNYLPYFQTKKAALIKNISNI